VPPSIATTPSARDDEDATKQASAGQTVISRDRCAGSVVADGRRFLRPVVAADVLDVA
jgi:hypothetical protein